MDGSPFKLATLAKADGRPFVAVVLDDEAVDLAAADIAYRSGGRRGALSTTASVAGLLENWDANFAVLQEIVAFLAKEGLRPGAAKIASLKALPPVTRPGKMFYAAQNFQEHVDEMIRAGMTPASGPKFTGEKSTTVPYLFLKAPSSLGGKSHDNFAPMGPFLVPRAFVPDHMNLFIRLTVNGEVRQNGDTSQFIFTPEEQIEYASNILTIDSGDIFSCGTCGGVGQGSNTFVKAGDVMETEIERLGKMRNRFVAEVA